MRFVTAFSTKFLTTLVVAIALLGVGFAHRLTAAVPSPELQAFFAAGGSWSDLCGDLDPDKDTPSARIGCDACRIVDAIVPTAITSGPIPVDLTERRADVAISEQIRLCRKPDTTRLSRAPPQT